MSKPRTLYFTLEIINPNEDNIYSVNNFFVDFGRVKTFDLKKHFPSISLKNINELDDIEIIAYTISLLNSHDVQHVFEIKSKDKNESSNIARTILNLYKENDEISENTKIEFKEFQKIQVDLTDFLV
jgi:hypothetical protein